jgi:hypothetical protein
VTVANIVELIRSTGLTGLVRQASDAAAVTDAGRLLPVLPELRPLLPAGGLRRGTLVGVTAGGNALLLALLAGASQAGSWCAVVGMPSLGLVAAAEMGVDLSRLALVPSPGPEWPGVVAALLDGIDIVVAAPPGPVATTVAGRLAARARQRGSVLVIVESDCPVRPMPSGRKEEQASARCPGVDVTLEAVHGEWEGLGAGRGRLTRRRLTVHARGRGAAARRREARLCLPTASGSLAVDTGVGYLTAVREAV